MTLSCGSRVGPYEILDLLGQGGMGAVYRARDPRLDRDVAIKVLRADVIGDRDHQSRFLQEARLRRHRHDAGRGLPLSVPLPNWRTGMLAAHPVAQDRWLPGSGDVLPHVVRQHLVDQRLVADPSAPGLLPELLEHCSVDANRDQLPGRVAERRPADSAHRRKLF